MGGSVAAAVIQPGPGDRHGLGIRVTVPVGAGSVESTLHVDQALVSASGFIDALVRQQDVLALLDHPQLAGETAVRPRKDGERRACAVVSVHPAGECLGHLLDRFEAAGARLSTAAVLYLVRELIVVLRSVHAHRAGGFHGALTTDAVVITTDQRVVLRDHIFGEALAAVSLPADRWWRDHEIPVPTTAGIPPFTPLTDQVQLGVLALSLFLGRRLNRSEYPGRVGALLEMVTETSIDGDEQPLGSTLRAWLERTLLVSADGPFRSLAAVNDSLDELLDADDGYVAAPIGLDVTPDDTDASAADAFAGAAPEGRPAEALVTSYDPFAVPGLRLAPQLDTPHDDDGGDDAECAADEGGAFVVESNDGSAAPMPSDGATYEPLDVSAPIGAARRADRAAVSVYDSAPDEAAIQTNAVPARPAGVPRPFWELLPDSAASPGKAAPARASNASPQAPVAGASVGTPQPLATSHDLRAAVADLERPSVRRDVAPQTPVAPLGEHEPGARAARGAGAQSVPAAPVAARAFGAEGRRLETHDLTRAAPRRGPSHVLDVEAEAAPRTGTRPRWLVIAAALAVVMGGALAAGYVYLWPKGSPAAAAAAAEPGRMHLESKPAGATVRVNGIDRGTTPVTLAVPPGAYRLEFERGDESRSISVVVTSNNETYQAVMLYPPGPPGEVRVNSVPAGALVSINGQPRGQTPVRVDELAPGEYTVVVENSVARSERKFEVLPAQATAVDIPLSGFVAVASPIPLRVHDGDQPLGELRNGRVAVGAGVRRLRLANYELGFEETREVDVAAGRVTPLVVTPPNGVLNITADTSTDVYLDGRPVGLTPLTNLAVALGVHEVTFRHARWGEQNYTVLVGLTTPSRLHVTMQSKAAATKRRIPTPARRRP